MQRYQQAQRQRKNSHVGGSLGEFLYENGESFRFLGEFSPFLPLFGESLGEFWESFGRVFLYEAKLSQASIVARAMRR